MSVAVNAIDAAKIAVNAPTIEMTTSATGDIAISVYMRPTRYTPAATIVAAWISALTGVGPSIASGSHTCSGNCADLPAAPMKRPSAIHVIAEPGIADALSAASISSKRSDFV